MSAWRSLGWSGPESPDRVVRVCSSGPAQACSSIHFPKKSVFHWIGLLGKIYRQPWYLHVFTMKCRGFL